MNPINNNISQKIFLSLHSFLGLTQKWKENNLKIVFTNGCFDILHRGHLDYLEKTSLLADKMVVGLNSDRSVATLKGSERPIVTEMDRAYLLASLSYIDAVVLFDEDTPLELIQSIMPDVLVKGGDYQIDQIVGAREVIEKGGKVQTIDFVHYTSTSAILEKIKSL